MFLRCFSPGKSRESVPCALKINGVETDARNIGSNSSVRAQCIGLERDFMGVDRCVTGWSRERERRCERRMGFGGNSRDRNGSGRCKPRFEHMEDSRPDCILQGAGAMRGFPMPADELLRKDQAAEFVVVSGSSMHDALQQFQLILVQVRNLPVDKRTDIFRQSIA